MPSAPPEPDVLERVLDVVTAISTAAAAGLAAWSAWISKGSARAAEASVEEARKARLAEQSPRLVLERDFLDFHFQWPHPDTLNGEPVFLARKDWKDRSPSPPTFSLTNYGQGPALEVKLVFDLEDPNGELTVPEVFAPLGLSIFHTPQMPNQPRVLALAFGPPHGRGSALPLYRRWTTDIPNCAPGQTRTVEFPVHLLNTLFLRGLQYWVRRGDEDAIRDVILTVRISAHTVDGVSYATQFRFKAFPFWQGLQDPLIVNGHFNELPMYPQGDDLRVA